MAECKRDRARTDKALRAAGIVVVMNRDHVKTAQDLGYDDVGGVSGGVCGGVHVSD